MKKVKKKAKKAVSKKKVKKVLKKKASKKTVKKPISTMPSIPFSTKKPEEDNFRVDELDELEETPCSCGDDECQCDHRHDIGNDDDELIESSDELETARDDDEDLDEDEDKEDEDSLEDEDEDSDNDEDDEYDDEPKKRRY